MAIIYSEELGNGFLGLWQITEEEEELLALAGLSADDLPTFSSFKASQRRKEWLAVRALLKQLIKEPAQIEYYPDGRPFLRNSAYQVSISHTKGYAAILLNNKEIPGIDIELESRSAEKVALRILTPEELESCRQNDGYSNKKLLIHWCAKETVFKMVPEHNVSYLKQIRVFLNNIESQPYSFSGNFLSENTLLSFDLFYKSINDLILIWGWKSMKNL